MSERRTHGKKILVYADWMGIKEPTLMGILYSDSNQRQRNIFHLSIQRDGCNLSLSRLLIRIYNAIQVTQYLSGNKNNFGIFLDSSPDDGEELIMQRREAIKRRAGRRERTLMESDFLLGVL